MKKKFLLITLMMCILGGINSLSLKAQEVTITGETASASRSIPIDVYNKCSISQTIYYSNEINKPNGGTISSISFKVSRRTDGNGNTQDGDYSYTRTIEVYMMNIDDNVLSENALTKLSANDLVYGGNLTISKVNHEDWVTIDLETEFKYEKGKNILVCVNDITERWEDYQVHFYTFKSDVTRILQMAGKSSAYDPTIENTNGINTPNQVPQIKLTFANTPTAPALVSPAVGTTISGTTVDLSWSYGVDNTATHYRVLLGTDNENLPVITDGWVARTELGTGGFATGDEFANVNLEYGKTYYWRVDVRNGEGDPVKGIEWSFKTPASTEFVFENEGDWNDANNWEGDAVPGNGAIVVINKNATIKAGDKINVADLTISDGASLTINGSLTITGEFSNEEASKLVINDGGQIFQTNEGVKATFNMIINSPSNWENDQDGWQLISSPFTDASINDFTIVEDGNDYDLYKFDGSKGYEWQNLKDQGIEFETEFILTRGYLASYKETGTASITGTLNHATELYLDKYDENNKITVTVGGNMHNFFLIGNPFPFDIDMSKMEYMQYLIEGYAILDNDGGNFQYVGTTGTIKAGDAFLIKTTGVDNDNNPMLYYSHTPSKSRSENHNSINLIATGAEGSDNLIISLSGAENEGFNKLENFNKDIATVFVVKNDIRYGIANFDNDVTMIDVAFEATKMGNYTIAAQPNGKFETLTLIDRFTGIETNLLVDDYHFTAMSEENNNRFFIRLGNGQQTTDNSHFVFQSGEELIIEAEGTVQIIDMMGRVVYTSNVENNNRINVSDFNNGAYVVRVINESEIKVEKVVIY